MTVTGQRVTTESRENHMITTSGSRVPAGGITFGGHNHKMATSRKRKVDVEVKEKRTYEWIGEGDIRDGARHYE